MKRIITTVFCLFICVSAAQAQRGGGNDWMTDNADAQRTATIKADAKINRDSVVKPGAVQFLWKYKVKNAPKGLNNLTPPSTLERLIGYKGFRMLGFLGASDDTLITIDTDLGRFEWEKKLPVAASTFASTLACPGGMTTSVIRPTITTIAQGGGGFGPGRYTPAKSSVGSPLEGAANLKDVRPPQNFGPPPGPAPSGAPQAPRPNQPPMGGGFGGGAQVIYALASDGKLHSMHLSGGQEYKPAVQFLPAGANASGLIIANGRAYAVTTNGCNGTTNGLWAYDFEANKAEMWKGNLAGSVSAAFGGDGTIFVTTNEAAEGAPAMSIIAIDPATLQTKSTYTTSRIFASSPVVFEHKGKTLVAAAAIDGAIHVVDAANMSTALSVTPATAKGAAPGSLASYVDRDGVRWVLVAHTGALPAGFTGSASKGAILAYRLGDDGKLTPGWASRDLTSPLTPTVINGVVIATSSGEFKSNDVKVTAARSGRAVVYLLDGASGKEVWSSGTTVTSFARGNALSGGMGQFYLTTYDGTIWAFGFPMEH
jgi:hypothetical protein